MAIKEQVDLWRAMGEPVYAAQLTDEQWKALILSPEFDELQVDAPDLAEALIDANQDKLARFGYGRRNSETINPSLAAGDDLVVLGKPHPYIQWLSIFNGSAEYAENRVMPNMVLMKTLRSPHPHAKVKSIDTSKAEALPGVVGVLHRFNMPDEYKESTMSGGPLPRFLFDEEIKQVGSPVVALVAESEQIADEALQLVEVEYEVLPAVVNYLEGATAAPQWDNDNDGTVVGIQEEVRGDMDAGWGDAEVTVENTTSWPTEQNAPLELSNTLMWWENERLNYIFTTRNAHSDRDSLAERLNLNSSQVHGTQLGYIGSSYGSHRTLDVTEIHAAILAKMVRRPVKAVFTRSEDFVYRTVRCAQTTESKLGFKRDGTLVAANYKTTAESGVSFSNRATGPWITFQTLYNIPNLRLEAVGVYTNSYRAGSFRCVSHPYAAFAQETLMDKAADELGINPLDLRLMNINEVGHPDTGRPYSNPGLRDCIMAVADHIGWAQKYHAPGANEVRPGVFHGIGLAAHTCSHGAGGHPSTATVVVHTDGTLVVVSAAAEVGGGQRTLMRMIGAETLGIPYEMTAISPQVDTDVTIATGTTAGSRQTNSGGWGVYEAAMDAKRQLLEGAAKKFAKDGTIEVTPEELDIRDGMVFVIKQPDTQMEVADAVTSIVPNTPVIGRGAHFHPPDWTRNAFGSHACEVEVDALTGTVKVLNYVAAHDVGRAMNPSALEEQIQGGVTMGMSAALYEGLFLDEATGLPITDNILEYKMISIHDVPRTIDVIFVENPKEYGVYGAHGIGEPPLSVAPPTIANAIHNAIGVWVGDLPMSREKILAALGSA